MMEDLAASLSLACRIADNVKNWNEFTEGSGDPAKCTEFSRAKGSDECSGSFFSRVTICSVGSN
jgi:hypothetical protein